jgi:hypothetical protein
MDTLIENCADADEILVCLRSRPAREASVFFDVGAVYVEGPVRAFFLVVGSEVEELRKENGGLVAAQSGLFPRQGPRKVGTEQTAGRGRLLQFLLELWWKVGKK